MKGGANEHNRPFFEEGVDGTGQTVSVSNLGLDTDNCYFWDASGEFARNSMVDLAPAARWSSTCPMPTTVQSPAAFRSAA